MLGSRSGDIWEPGDPQPLRLIPDTALAAWAQQCGEGMRTPGNLDPQPLRLIQALPKSGVGARWLQHKLRTQTCQCSKPRETYQWRFSQSNLAARLLPHDTSPGHSYIVPYALVSLPPTDYPFGTIRIELTAEAQVLKPWIHPVRLIPGSGTRCGACALRI